MNRITKQIKKGIILLGLMTITFLGYSQYPNNENGIYQDMLTPEYYNTTNGGAFRVEVNKYVHFARLIPFQHPLKNSLGQIPTYTVPRGFGDGIGFNNTSQHHSAFDMHVGNNDSTVVMVASIDGLVNTYRNAPKYRDYLTITKNIEDSLGNILGKMVVLYGHIDLNLDSLDNRILNGQFITQGDTISKHLFSETLGGAHLHFEIRYYRSTDSGVNDFYNWQNNSPTTSQSSGSWSYGYWDPEIGYGFAHPDNHLDQLISGIHSNDITDNISIYPNPAKDYFNINLNNTSNNISSLMLIALNGKIILQKDFVNKIRVNTSNLNRGIYFITIKDGSKTVSRKIIIE